MGASPGRFLPMGGVELPRLTLVVQEVVLDGWVQAQLHRIGVEQPMERYQQAALFGGNPWADA